LQFRKVDRDDTVSHSPYLLGIGGNPVSTKYVVQVFNLLFRQCTPMSEPTDMGVNVGGDDNDIIEVDEQGFLV